MNKNNIFNFVKYLIFAGILYFSLKKFPSINISEMEIIALVIIIGSGMYSYECLVEKFFTKKESMENLNEEKSKKDIKLQMQGFRHTNLSSDTDSISISNTLETFSNDSDLNLDLDIDIDEKYDHLNKNYTKKELKNKSRSNIKKLPQDLRDKSEIPDYKTKQNKKATKPKSNEYKSKIEDNQKVEKTENNNSLKSKKSVIKNAISRENNIRKENQINEETNENKLYNELILPNNMSSFAETNYKDLVDDELDNRGLVRKKYDSKGPNVLRVANAFKKGTNEVEKILIDPETGNEVKLKKDSKFVYTDENKKKSVFIVDDEIEKDEIGLEQEKKVLKKIYIDDEKLDSVIREQESESDTEDEKQEEEDDDEPQEEVILPPLVYDDVSEDKILKEIEDLKKMPKPKILLPKMPKAPKVTTQKEEEEIQVKKGIKQVDPDEVEDVLQGGLKLRSKKDTLKIEKEFKKAELQAAIQKAKKIATAKVMGKPIKQIIGETVSEKPATVTDKPYIKHTHEHQHGKKSKKHKSNQLDDKKRKKHESNQLDCKSEVSKIKKELTEEINKLKSELNNQGSGVISFIEKRKIKVLLKHLVKRKILDDEDVADIYKTIESDKVPLSKIIKSLESLKHSSAYVSDSDDEIEDEVSIKPKRKGRDTGKYRYGDMKYNELPDVKLKPIGDQVPDDWENEYTLLNTDKWAVPQTHPKLCISNSNLNPLPSNTPGYPMSLKEWDNSRVISNTYINKKWAMDQVDSS